MRIAIAMIDCWRVPFGRSMKTEQTNPGKQTTHLFLPTTMGSSRLQNLPVQPSLHIQTKVDRGDPFIPAGMSIHLPLRQAALAQSAASGLKERIQLHEQCLYYDHCK